MQGEDFVITSQGLCTMQSTLIEFLIVKHVAVHKGIYQFHRYVKFVTTF